MSNKKYIFISIIAIFSFSCHNIQKLDTTAMKEQMGNTEIKRLTPAQIADQVQTLGDKIIKTITPNVENSLKTISSQQITANCQLTNNKLIDSLSKTYDVKIRLLGKSDTQNKLLYTKEQEVIDAYVYNVENHLPLATNIQKIGDSLFVYSSPISEDNLICKTCFPSDENNLAVWSIVFSKAAIIRKIDMKKIK